MKAALHVPGFRRLYGGLAASMIGDSLMLIVLSLWVKTLTGSNGAAGLTFLWLTLPALIAPVFGYVVDRLPRRTFLVWANVGSALAVLPLLLVHDASDVWIIYLVALAYGVSFIVVPAALNGLMKDLLPEDVLVDANASLSVTREALRLGGPLAGAALFATVGGGSVALLDAVSFLVAAFAVATLTVSETAPAQVTGRWWRAVGAGAAHIRRTPLLLHPTVSLAITLLVVGFCESAVFAVVDAFHKPATFVGPLLTAQGVGAVAGGLLAARVVRAVGEARTLAVGLVLMAVGLGGVAAAVELWQVMAVVVVTGAGLPMVLVAWTTLLQKETPGQLMGRVSTAADVLVTTPQALSIATGAMLVTLVDYRVLFLMMGAGVALAAAYVPLALRGRLDRVVGTTLEPVLVPAEA